MTEIGRTEECSHTHRQLDDFVKEGLLLAEKVKYKVLLEAQQHIWSTSAYTVDKEIKSHKTFLHCKKMRNYKHSSNSHSNIVLTTTKNDTLFIKTLILLRLLLPSAPQLRILKGLLTALTGP